MVRKNRPRASSLFLMELILAIFFFSIASAVCVQFFVKSHLLSHDSDALNHAVNECAGVAEILDTADSISDSIDLLKQLYSSESYPDTVDLTEADISFCYDDNFLPCSAKDSAYILYLHIEQSEQMLSTDMKFCTDDDDEELLYRLNTEHHIARRTGYEKE